MQGLPLVCIGIKRRVRQEVAGAEGLQRVLGGQGGEQGLGHLLLFGQRALIVGRLVGKAPALAEVIAQLPDQHAGRLLAVVLGAASAPADGQSVPR